MDAAVAYRPKSASFEIRAHRVGEREDVYYAPDFSSKRVTLPAYVRTDASADVPVFSESGRSATLTFRAENLFDVRYADLAGYNTDFAKTDDASLRLTGYRAPGRRLLAGLRFSI
jgi:outer membrane receptor protein involved in Fe transport